VASILALGAALSWGAGDFLGGMAARRISVVAVLAVSQTAGLIGLVAWVLATRERPPGIEEIAPAAAGGVAGVVGLAAFYRALALGAIGIVAPISAAGPVVPLVVDAAQGITPSGLQLAGVALVLGGIITLSHERSEGGRRSLAAGAALALLAGLGFGAYLVGLDAGSDVSASWGVLSGRASETVIALAAAAFTATSLCPAIRLMPSLVAVGAFDTGANVLVAVATTKGAVGIVAVLSGLYPIVTVLLARFLIAERLSLSRRVGAGLALAGAALVAAG
jgi:drug/metabolite transporter (DMT)-like permease